MKILVFVLVFFWSMTSQADEWTAADSATQAVVLLSLSLDYLQTRQIVSCARTGDRCAREGDLESNPVMGERGQRVPVEVYFLTMAAGHTLIATQLPQPYRRVSQIALVVIQTKVVGHNLGAGYAFEF